MINKGDDCMKKYNDYFYCYSNNIKEFLMKRGHRYITIAINPNSNMQYWLFKRDKGGRLTKDIDEWFKLNKE